MTTRKTNQLDLRVDGVQDIVVREALVQITDFINIMVGVGLTTDGVVRATRGLNTNDKTFKAKLFTGKLSQVGGTDPFDHQTLIVPGLILGATGYAQFDGTDQWRTMGRGTVTTSCYFELVTDNKIDRVSIRNSDAVNPNNYRVIIFYTETDA